MPVSKTTQFTKNELKISLTARALAHPARVRIIKLLREHNTCRNTDLVNQLSLTKSSVHNHVKKLKDAKLIHITYLPNSFFITLNKKKMIESISFYER